MIGLMMSLGNIPKEKKVLLQDQKSLKKMILQLSKILTGIKQQKAFSKGFL